MESATERIAKILDHVKSTERPNITEALIAIDIVLATARADVLDILRLQMRAKLVNPPLPELNF